MSLQLRIDTTTRHLGSSRLLSPGASCSARSHTRNGSASSVASTLSVVSPPSSSTNASSTSLPLRRSPSPEYTVDPDADLALALHDFEPENVNSTCLSFKIRQIIVVHNRDPSGWWDGEILGSRGQRGWFPSNYVREYSVPELEADLKRQSREHANQTSHHPWYEDDTYCPPIMNAVVHGMNVLNSSIHSNRPGHISPSVACIIQGVRTILDAADCRTRDTPTIKQYPILLSERAKVLDSLKALVKQSTVATQTATAVQVLDNAIERAGEMPNAELPDPKDQEKLRAAGRKESATLLRVSNEAFTVTRKFLATATQCGVELPERHGVSGTANTTNMFVESGGSVPVSPVTDDKDMTARLPLLKSSGVITSPGSVKARSMSNLQPKRLNSLPNNTATATASNAALLQPTPKQPTPQKRERNRTQPAEGTSRQKIPHVKPIDVGTSRSRASSVSSAHSAMSMPHLSTFPSGPTPVPQVLAALRHTHDHYISTVAAFIGHAHSHSRGVSHAASTGHMFDLVHEMVDMVCRLLTIVDAVANASNAVRPPISPSRIDKLRYSKESLYTITSRLAESVRLLTVSVPLGITEEEERNGLLRDATLALKAAADCVFAVKTCLSQAPGGAPMTIDVPDIENSPLDPRFKKPKLERSTSHMEFTARSPLPVDEDLTIQAVSVGSVTPPAPTPTAATAPLIRARETSSGSEESGSVPSGKLSIDTRPTSPEETQNQFAASLKSPTPSIFSRTDDGTTWEGSLRNQPASASEPMSAGVAGSSSLAAAATTMDENTEQQGEQGSMPWMFTPDYPLEEIAYNSDGHIVGASMVVLVEKLTPHDSMIDSLLQTVFFLTFRLFSTPLELVDAVIARYNLLPPSSISEDEMALWQHRKGLPVRLRVSNFIKLWVEEYWRDGMDDPALVPLVNFTRGALAPMFPQPAERILDALELRRQGRPVVVSGYGRGGHRMHAAGIPLNPPVSVFQQQTEIPRPTMTKTLLANLRNSNFSAISITDFDPLELARQITIMENELYCAIRPEEVLETGMEGAPRVNVKKMSSLSTVITGWVAESILNELDLKKRATLVKFFIKVADRCASLSNFSTSRSILAALDSSTISRLTQTWMALPSKYKTQLESLRRLADHSRNYHEYRSKLRNTHPPAVPFLGLYLTDVTFCREGNPSHRSSPTKADKKLINFNKYHKLWRIVQDMQRFQVEYKLKAIPEVHNYLNATFKIAGHHGDLQDLYRRSLMIEPKQSLSEAPTPASEGRHLFNWGRPSTTIPPTAT